MHLNHCYAIRYTNVWIRCTCPEKRQLKDQSWQQVQIWSNSRTIFQQSFSAAAGSFNFILFQHRPTQLTNPFRCQSEPFYEVHINVQWTLSTPKKSPKMDLEPVYFSRAISNLWSCESLSDRGPWMAWRVRACHSPRSRFATSSFFQVQVFQIQVQHWHPPFQQWSTVFSRASLQVTDQHFLVVDHCDHSGFSNCITGRWS